jgi:hypothetical protein
MAATVLENLVAILSKSLIKHLSMKARGRVKVQLYAILTPC